MNFAPMRNPMTNLSLWKKACAVFVLCAATAIISPAQTFTNVFQFDYADGGFPEPTTLVQGTDGEFYGTTYAGGVQHIGVIFKVTSAGAMTTLFGFQGPYNAHSTAGLIQATDGNFYGTTSGFGFLTPKHRDLFSAGTVIKITPGGT